MYRAGWVLVLLGIVIGAASALPLAHYMLFVDPTGNQVGLGMLW
jgi:hypothetical protein